MHEVVGLQFEVQELPQWTIKSIAVLLAMKNQRLQTVHLAVSPKLGHHWQRTWCARRCSIAVYGILWFLLRAVVEQAGLLHQQDLAAERTMRQRVLMELLRVAQERRLPDAE